MEKLCDLSYVACLLATVDMFEHIYKHSLYVQTVNTLPWEVLSAELELVSLFERIANDAHEHHTLDPELFPMLMADGRDDLRHGNRGTKERLL